MNIKPSIVNSLKSVKNITENNIKTDINNTITERELNSILFKGVDLKKEIIEIIT